jgi:hypothetical protein
MASSYKIKGVTTDTQVRDEYSVLVDDVWTVNTEAYDGGGGFINGTNLIRFVRETDEGFTRRKKRCHYSNYARALTDTIMGHLFKKPPARETGDDILDKFIGATNKNQTKTLTELIKEAALYAHIKGISYILVDKPAIEAESKLQEEREAMAYAYVLQAEDIVDWQKDDNDEYLWVKVAEVYIPDEEKRKWNGDHTQMIQYRVWTRDGWILLNDKSGVVDRGEHTLGKVPIIAIKEHQSLLYPDLGDTEFTALAQKNLRLFNIDSEIDLILINQTFAILCINSSAPFSDPADSDDTTSEKNYVSIGTNGAITYAEGLDAPSFISPDTASIDSYMKVREQLLSDMREIARQNFTGGVNSSGKAREHDFEKTNQAITAKAETLEDAEKGILALVAAWMGIDNPEITIEYPRDFNLSDLDKDLDHVFKKMELDISPTYLKEVKKQASRTLLPKIPQSTQDEIDEEIETFEELPDIEATIDDDETEESEDT